jgi:hypothetical protein
MVTTQILAVVVAEARSMSQKHCDINQHLDHLPSSLKKLMDIYLLVRDPINQLRNLL